MSVRKALTRIELVAVIAVVILNLAIIMPLLGASRERALEAVCLSNQKQLLLAWTSYHHDNDGLLVGGSNYYNGTRGTPYRWVEYPLLHDTDNPETTPPAGTSQYSLVTRKNGIRAGKLYAYTQNENLYHCPADMNTTKAEPFAIYRSYSIAGLMNSEDFLSRVAGLYSPISIYRSAVTSPGGPMKPLVVAVKFSDITAPSSNYVFVEEDVSGKNQTVNAGGFMLFRSGYYDWWDWPASYHNDRNTFGFADGHAEIHRWQDPRTINLMKGISGDPYPLGNEDLHWLANGYLPVRP
jgi:prepilin-type processing-associated H-X9-DG protein